MIVDGWRSAGGIRAVADGQVAAGARQLHVLPEEPAGARTQAVVLLVARHGGLSRGRDHRARAPRTRRHPVLGARPPHPRTAQLLLHAGRQVRQEERRLPAVQVENNDTSPGPFQ